MQVLFIFVGVNEIVLSGLGLVMGLFGSLGLPLLLIGEFFLILAHLTLLLEGEYLVGGESDC